MKKSTDSRLNETPSASITYANIVSLYGLENTAKNHSLITLHDCDRNNNKPVIVCLVIDSSKNPGK